MQFVQLEMKSTRKFTTWSRIDVSALEQPEVDEVIEWQKCRRESSKLFAL